jgi:hypothetical protein
VTPALLTLPLAKGELEGVPMFASKTKAYAFARLTLPLAKGELEGVPKFASKTKAHAFALLTLPLAENVQLLRT